MEVNKNWKLFTGLIVLCALLLSGCHHDQKQAENIYTNLEKAADLEKTFADHQQTLNKAEKEEQTIYHKIMDLDMDHVDQLKEYIKSALEKNKEQSDLLNELNAGLDKAYELSLSVQSSIKKIKDKEQQSLAGEASELLTRRYELFEDYYDQYMDVLKVSGQFYEDLKKKDRDANALDKQINKINEQYSKMEKQQEQFNHITEQYNETKVQYYRSAGLTKHT
jgi:ABC-type transporter Mla subunit MlaD